MLTENKDYNCVHVAFALLHTIRLMLTYILRPSDAHSYLLAFLMTITGTQTRISMPLWPELFKDMSVFDNIVTKGCELTLASKDIYELIVEIRFPQKLISKPNNRLVEFYLPPRGSHTRHVIATQTRADSCKTR